LVNLITGVTKELHCDWLTSSIETFALSASTCCGGYGFNIIWLEFVGSSQSLNLEPALEPAPHDTPNLPYSSHKPLSLFPTQSAAPPHNWPIILPLLSNKGEPEDPPSVTPRSQSFTTQTLFPPELSSVGGLRSRHTFIMSPEG